MIWEIFGISYTLAIVLLGSAIVGLMTGVLSVFFVLEKKSVMGDTIAHSSLPGVVVAFLLFLEKSQLAFAIGALISGFLAIIFVQTISRRTVLKEDVAIGVTLSIFFGVGVALLTYVQSLPLAAQAGLINYIFGNVAFLLKRDLYLLTAVTVFDLFVIISFWKEYKLIMFDRAYAEIIGLPVNKLDLLLTIAISVTIVVGIQIIGVVMIAGMLIAPAVGARQWTNSYRKMILISASIGVMSGVLGTLISANITDIPPGPAIIVFATSIAFISILFGYRHGTLVNWVHTHLTHRKIDHRKVMMEFLKSTNALDKSEGLTRLEFSLREYPMLNKEIINNLARCGYCKWLTDEKCAMTLRGVEIAKDFTVENSGSTEVVE